MGIRSRPLRKQSCGLFLGRSVADTNSFATHHNKRVLSYLKMNIPSLRHKTKIAPTVLLLIIIIFKDLNKNIILVISEEDLNSVKNSYYGHIYNEKILRKYEPQFFIHSTTMDN